jgi:FolB domain-containing protein
VSHQRADRIFIRDLLVRGILGINADERRERQDIVVNLQLEVDVAAVAQSEELSSGVNYRDVSKRVIERIEAGSDLLVERLAEDLAGMILEGFPVRAVTVRVEKPGALRFAASVGVEITRLRGRA